MAETVYAAIRYLQEANKYLDEDDLNDFDEARIQKYLDSFKVVFLEKTKDITKQTFLDLCFLERLYSLQLKLNVDLPPYAEEIAHDLDNPDYPGYDYVAEKIINKSYKIYSVRP